MRSFAIRLVLLTCLCASSWAMADGRSLVRWLCGGFLARRAPQGPTLFGHPVRPAPQTADELFDAFRYGLVPNLADPEQELAWEIYRRAAFGNPNYSLESDTNRRIDAYIKKYPHIAKRRFRNGLMTQARWEYTRPAELDEFLKGHRRAVHELRRTLLEIVKNAGFWAKRLGIDQQFKHIADTKERNTAIENEVRRIFPEALRQQLLDTRIPGAKRFEHLFRRVAELREADTYVKGPGDPLAQVLADIAHVQGFDDAVVAQNLQESNPLVVIAGYRKALLFRHMFLEQMGIAQGWEGFLAQTGVKKPTNTPADQMLSSKLNALYAEVDRTKKRLEGPGTRKRVRLLSLVESADRSCLGDDCATRTYLETGLDDLFHYWTLTDPATGHSSGHVTAAIGTAGGKKVILFDKTQNVRNEELADFYESIRKIALELGYLVVLPVDLSIVPSGFSNDPGTTQFVQQMPSYKQQKEVLGVFQLAHSTSLPAGYSATRLGLQVKVLLPHTSETEFVLEEHTAAPWRTERIDIAALATRTHALKDGGPEEKARYLAIEPSLQQYPQYRDADFERVIAGWVGDRTLPLSLRKAVLTHLLRANKFDELAQLSDALELEQRAHILDAWLQSDTTHDVAVRALAHLYDWARGNEHLMRIVAQDHPMPEKLIAWATGRPEVLDELAKRIGSERRAALFFEHGRSPRDASYKRVFDAFYSDGTKISETEQFARALADWAKAKGLRAPIVPHFAAWIADDSVTPEAKLAGVKWILRERLDETEPARVAALEYVRGRFVTETILNADVEESTRLRAMYELEHIVPNYPLKDAFAQTPARDAREKVVRLLLHNTRWRGEGLLYWGVSPGQVQFILTDSSFAGRRIRAEVGLTHAIAQSHSVSADWRNDQVDAKAIGLLISRAEEIRAAGGGTYHEANATPPERPLREAFDATLRRLLLRATNRHGRQILAHVTAFTTKEAADLFLRIYDNSVPEEAAELAAKYGPRFAGTPQERRVRAHLAVPRTVPVLASELAPTFPSLPSTIPSNVTFVPEVTVRTGAFRTAKVSFVNNELKVDGKSIRWLDGTIQGFFPLADDTFLLHTKNAKGEHRYSVQRYHRNLSDFRDTEVGDREVEPFRYPVVLPKRFYFDAAAQLLVITDAAYSETIHAVSTAPGYRLLPVTEFTIVTPGKRIAYRFRDGVRNSKVKGWTYAVTLDARAPSTTPLEGWQHVELGNGKALLYDGHFYQWMTNGVITGNSPAKYKADDLSMHDVNFLAEANHQPTFPSQTDFDYDFVYFPPRFTALPDGGVFVASQKGNRYEWFRDGVLLGSVSLSLDHVFSPPLHFYPTPDGNLVAVNGQRVVWFDLHSGAAREERYTNDSPLFLGARVEADGTVRVRHYLYSGYSDKPGQERDLLLQRPKALQEAR